jgi:hypothetical protein
MPDLSPYQKLVSQLKTDINNLESLYHERERMQSEKQRLQDLRKQISDELFKHLSDSQKLALIQGNLEQVDRELNLQNAVYTSLGSHIQTAEADLHNLVPKACHTFTRLLLALRKQTLEHAQQNIASLIKEPDRFKVEIAALAEGSIEFVEVCRIEIPSGGNWMLIRPLTDADRQQTLDFCVATAHSLCEAAGLLFEKLGPAEIPEFYLGELLVEGESPDLQPQFDLDQLGILEREFVERLCRDAGKELDKLTEQEKLVLQASLANFYSQPQFRAAQPVSQSFTNWDGTQV